MVTPAANKVLQGKFLKLSKQEIQSGKIQQRMYHNKIIMITLYHNMETTTTYMLLFCLSSQAVKELYKQKAYFTIVLKWGVHV